MYGVTPGNLVMKLPTLWPVRPVKDARWLTLDHSLTKFGLKTLPNSPPGSGCFSDRIFCGRNRQFSSQLCLLPHPMMDASLRRWLRLLKLANLPSTCAVPLSTFWPFVDTLSAKVLIALVLEDLLDKKLFCDNSLSKLSLCLRFRRRDYGRPHPGILMTFGSLVAPLPPRVSMESLLVSADLPLLRGINTSPCTSMKPTLPSSPPILASWFFGSRQMRWGLSLLLPMHRTLAQIWKRSIVFGSLSVHRFPRAMMTGHDYCLLMPTLGLGPSPRTTSVRTKPKRIQRSPKHFAITLLRKIYGYRQPLRITRLGQEQHGRVLPAMTSSVYSKTMEP